MMFNRDLFYSLCEKHNVELSKTASKPMIKENGSVHIITNEELLRFFTSCEIYFGYSVDKMNAEIKDDLCYKDNYSIAC